MGKATHGAESARHPTEVDTEFSISAIARQFGVNSRTAAEWVSRGCPKSLAQAIELWRASALRQERMPRGKLSEWNAGDAPRSLHEERLKADTAKIKEDVRLRRLRYRERTGKLVSRDQVVREAAELAVRIKERLLAAPDEFETRFPAEVRAQCTEDFREFIHQLLLEMSSWRIEGEATDDHVVAAAAQIARRRTQDSQ